MVQISTRVVELAWIFSYVYYDYYKRRLEGTRPMAGAVGSSGDDVQPSLDLLRWALLELTEGRADPWPSEAPQPSGSPDFASPEHFADELALCAVAFFLHHELAHLYLNPKNGGTDIEHERACDAAAAEWILGGDDLDDRMLQKRALGSAFGLLMLTARGIRIGFRRSESHPPDFERLLDVLLPRVPAQQELVWGVVLGMLRLHAQQEGLPELDGGPYEDFQTASLAYRDVFRTAAAQAQTTRQPG